MNKLDSAITKITNLASSQNAVTKSYVDAIAMGNSNAITSQNYSTFLGNITTTYPNTGTWTGPATGVNWAPEWNGPMVIPAPPELKLLITILGVQEAGLTQGLIFDLEGKRYSLIDILQAQVQQMMRLNTLFAHRDLGGRNE